MSKETVESLDDEIEKINVELQKIEDKEKAILFDRALKNHTDIEDTLIKLAVRITEYSEKSILPEIATKDKVFYLKKQIAFLEKRVAELKEQLYKIDGYDQGYLDTLKKEITKEYNLFLDLLSQKRISFETTYLPKLMQSVLKEVVFDASSQ